MITCLGALIATYLLVGVCLWISDMLTRYAERQKVFVIKRMRIIVEEKRYKRETADSGKRPHLKTKLTEERREL